MHALLLALLASTVAAIQYSDVGMLCLVNKERAHQGLKPLGLDPKLTRAAVLHSEDQAHTRRMSHTGSDGSDPGARVSRAGFEWNAVAENVAYGYHSMEEVMHTWMNSPGHRANILSRKYTMFGSGICTNGQTYFTQDFGNDGKGARNVPKCDGSDANAYGSGNNADAASGDSGNYGGNDNMSDGNYGGNDNMSNGNYGGNDNMSNGNYGGNDNMSNGNYGGNDNMSNGNYGGNDNMSDGNYGGGDMSGASMDPRGNYNQGHHHHHHRHGGQQQDYNDFQPMNDGYGSSNQGRSGGRHGNMGDSNGNYGGYSGGRHGYMGDSNGGYGSHGGHHGGGSYGRY